MGARKGGSSRSPGKEGKENGEDAASTVGPGAEEAAGQVGGK